MGRVTVVLPDELEKRFREYLFRKYGYKYYGKLSKHIAEALERWLDKEE